MTMVRNLPLTIAIYAAGILGALYVVTVAAMLAVGAI
jgi:hypothetical protein